MGGVHLNVFWIGWRGDLHIRLNITIVGGGATDWHAVCVCVVYLYCICVCTLVSVYLIGCVLKQVSRVDVASLCRALWAPSELSYWMARGLPVAMGGRWRAGRGNLEGELFVENLVCSGVLEILLSRYSVDRVRCELRESKKGGVGSYYRQASLCLTKRNKESCWTYLTCIATCWLCTDRLVGNDLDEVNENTKRELK